MFQIEHLYKCILYILLSLHTLLCSIEVILLGQSTAKMKLYSLPCLLEGDICRFQTIQLEFPKAKEILEMLHYLMLIKDGKASNCMLDKVAGGLELLLLANNLQVLVQGGELPDHVDQLDGLRLGGVRGPAHEVPYQLL